MCPGSLGGVEWNGPALDVKNHAIVVGAVDFCMVYKSAVPEYKMGDGYYGGSAKAGPNDRAYGWVTSVDAASGKVRWRYEAAAPVVAGVTPTAGGVTLAGDLQGNFLLFDSSSGKVLFQQRLPAPIAGGIVTYAVEGNQYIAVTSGNLSRATFGGGGTPELVIFGLGLVSDAPTVTTVGERRMAWQLAQGPDAGTRGKSSFATNCAACHGGRGEGGVGPSLLGAKERLGYPTIVDRIVNPLPKMPKLPLERT